MFRMNESCRCGCSIIIEAEMSTAQQSRETVIEQIEVWREKHPHGPRPVNGDPPMQPPRPAGPTPATEA